jgi:hypothetical protein
LREAQANAQEALRRSGENLAAKQRASEERHAAKARAQVFQVGDQVAVLWPSTKKDDRKGAKKLNLRWRVEPWTVEEVCGRNVYRIRLGRTVRKYNANRLRRYNPHWVDVQRWREGTWAAERTRRLRAQEGEATDDEDELVEDEAADGWFEAEQRDAMDELAADEVEAVDPEEQEAGAEQDQVDWGEPLDIPLQRGMGEDAQGAPPRVQESSQELARERVQSKYPLRARPRQMDWAAHLLDSDG